MNVTTPVQDLPALVIEPRRELARLQLGELWACRELFHFLVWRDIKVRHKQTALGAAWAILPSLATTFVFTLFFGRLSGIGSDGPSNLLFSYVGLLVWTFFAQWHAQLPARAVGSAKLITEGYFRRFVIPHAVVFAGLLDLAVATPLFGVMMADYKVWLGVPGWALGLNPMTGVVEGFRWALPGRGAVPISLIAASAIVTLVLCVTRALYLRSVERSFADVV